jgi:hypothetical protein
MIAYLAIIISIVNIAIVIKSLHSYYLLEKELDDQIKLARNQWWDQQYKKKKE